MKTEREGRRARGQEGGAEGSAKVQIGAKLLCKSAKVRGKAFSGLRSRPSGAWFRRSGSGAGSGTDFIRRPHLYLITRTRYLRAETWDPKMFSLR